MARELREHHKGRTDPQVLSAVSDVQLVQATLDGRAWLRQQIAKADAGDTRPVPETEEQLRARVIAERVLKEVGRGVDKDEWLVEKNAVSLLPFLVRREELNQERYPALYSAQLGVTCHPLPMP
jgi:hypothetical protein